MRYLIIVSNQKAPIDEDEIPIALKAIEKGGIVVLKHIIFNSAYFQAIIPDHEGSMMDRELQSYGFKTKAPSEFAKLLSPKMKMLSYKEQTKALEEAAKEERKQKR